MKKELKHFSITDVEVDYNEEDIDFAHAKIYALSEGTNSHKNPFDFEILKRDAHTILGKFVVAKFNKLTNDAEAHEKDEAIVGYIDPRETVEFLEKEVDGENKRFIVINALLSKIYARDIVDMFKVVNERSVSCEFSCIEGDEDENGEKPILEYQMHGITILGLSYRPSSKGTEIKILKFSEDFNLDIEKEVKEEEMAKDIKFKEYAVSIGDDLWGKIYNALKEKYPMEDNGYIYSKYRIKGIYEEGDEKFTIVEDEDGGIFKIVFVLEENSFELSDELIDVKIDFIETEMFSQKDFKEYEEALKVELGCGVKLEEEENIVMEEETKEEEEEVEEMEEVEPTETEMEETPVEEKAFSLDAYADMGAILALLEAETEQNQELAKRVMSEMLPKDIVMEFVEMAKEIEELKEFKFKVEDADREKKFSNIMATVKEDLDEKTFSDLQEEGKKLNLEQLGAFENKVKAFAYEATKKSMSEPQEEILIVGMAEGETKNTELSADDVYNKYL